MGVFRKMKKDNFLILGKSLLQTAIGLFIFVPILLLILLIRYLLEEVFNISFPINKEDLSLIFAILATIGTAVYLYNSDKSEKEKEEIKKQIDLLEVLSAELNFLEKNLESYKETFSKKSHYPFYELWNIDVSIYFNGLGHRINNQETIKLKKNLIIIKDKLLITKNMKDEAWRLEREKETNPIIEKVGAIDMIRKQIVKIINADILPVIERSEILINKIKKNSTKSSDVGVQNL